MTKGLSPKVKLPTVAKIILGVLLLVVWVLTDGHDTQNPLFVTGTTLVGAGVFITLPFGYKASPGEIAVDIGKASDGLLSGAASNHAASAAEPRSI